MDISTLEEVPSEIPEPVWGPSDPKIVSHHASTESFSLNHVTSYAELEKNIGEGTDCAQTN